MNYEFGLTNALETRTFLLSTRKWGDGELIMN